MPARTTPPCALTAVGVAPSTSGFVPQQADHVRSSQLCEGCHTLITKALGPNGDITLTSSVLGAMVEVDGQPYSIVYFQFVKPGKGTAFTRTKLKNMLTGNVIERTYRTGERLEVADVEEQPMQFLYNNGDTYTFMNTETFEQMHLTRDFLGDAVNFLIPNLKVEIEFYEGKPMGIELPPTVDLKVIEPEPGLKGATVSNVTKPAKTETGLVVQVPPFITEGEKIRVNTAEGTYQERA